MKRKTDNFSKFFEKKSNSAIKEQFKQEKKAEKKARKEGIERHFEEKRKNKVAGAGRPAEPETGSSQSGVKSRKPASSPSTVGSKKPFNNERQPAGGENNKSNEAKSRSQSGPSTTNNKQELIPLNKYLSHSGVCSRRDAAEIIKQGKVLVNGDVVTEPGTKVSTDDLVKVSGKKISITKNLVYILLNKPKDYITTTEDPQGRKTVLALIKHATTERVYPVGRLDRNTSGVLLLTNDGDLAQKLAHPKHEIKKVYQVTLDKVLAKSDFEAVAAGVQLEDGPAFVDAIAYSDANDKTQVGLEIHSGRNRIVRRIFEHLGYDVRGLDRVMYAGLTKKNVQRGKWRFLAEKEIRILKYLNSSIK